MIREIILGFVGSGAFAAIVTAIINAISGRKGLKSKVRKLEKDSVRLQLLLLMSDYPEERQEIMNIAEYYFATLKSNWYMTSLFDKWLKKNGIDRPSWFRDTEA